MRLKPLLTLTALIGFPLLLQGCTAVAVTGAAVGTAVGVTGAVIGTTGKVVGAAIPDGDDKKKDKKDKKNKKDED
ncbi:MAG: NF038104 family lipoprotein [Asticcacaulis sp.]|jgi:hypothetical protein|uniref:NF038104 family lipoprotein n=1 Tax=Asticcacaulis sp. TaxID=1872648 RepID=UPI0025B900BF|nr:NF038104 family lipoprotein [Asticcacaulis sp.]MCA1934062.1 NF038104 family lipoprotein [Asticcacaulis sp.]